MNCYKLYKTDFRDFYIFSKINQCLFLKKHGCFYVIIKCYVAQLMEIYKEK